MRQTSQNTSASYPPASPHAPSVCAYSSAMSVSFGSLGDGALCLGELGRGSAHGRRRKRHEERAHGRVVADRADELAHDAGAPVDPHRSVGRLVVAGEDPQHGRLADAVRTDERDALAVADPERDVVEQAMSAAGALPRQALHFDRAHGEATLRGRSRRRRRFAYRRRRRTRRTL